MGDYTAMLNKLVEEAKEFYGIDAKIEVKIGEPKKPRKAEIAGSWRSGFKIRISPVMEKTGKIAKAVIYHELGHLAVSPVNGETKKAMMGYARKIVKKFEKGENEELARMLFDQYSDFKVNAWLIYHGRYEVLELMKRGIDPVSRALLPVYEDLARREKRYEEIFSGNDEKDMENFYRLYGKEIRRYLNLCKTRGYSSPVSSLPVSPSLN